MKKIYLLLIIFSTFFACEQETVVQEINVNDYGIMPNTGENLTAKINQLIEGLEDGNALLVFPKGRYDFYPDSSYLRPYYETNTYDINPKKLAILIKEKENIVIDGQGSEFIYHGHIQPLTVDNSENITIKNINIDWDYPLTAESEIIEADENHILIKIDTTQFPFKINDEGLTFAAEGWEADWKLHGGSWLIEFDNNHIIPPNTGDNGTVRGDLKNVRYSEPTPGMVLMEGKFTKLPTVGNHWVMRHSTRDHAGIFLFHSKNSKLENINIYHTSGLGILSQYCENIEMRKVNMIPNASKNRYLSGHDDGLHFMGCKGEIIVDDCDAQGLMDDPINIHGTYVSVLRKVDDYTVKCKFAPGMSTRLIWAQEGDIISFVDKPTMAPIGYGVVSEFKVLDEIFFELTFEEKLPKKVSIENSLENLSWTPNVTITNCYAGSNRARGYLISTPGKVLIENNVFETSGSAILIAGDANYWYESGAVTDVTIRNNEFKSSCNSSPYQFCFAVISIFPEIPNINPGKPFHRNIKIDENRFNLSDYPIIYAKSVDSLSFTNNSITRSLDFASRDQPPYNYILNACRNVLIANNEVADEVPGKNAFLINMRLRDLIVKNDSITVLHE